MNETERESPNHCKHFGDLLFVFVIVPRGSLVISIQNQIFRSHCVVCVCSRACACIQSRAIDATNRFLGFVCYLLMLPKCSRVSLLCLLTRAAQRIHTEKNNYKERHEIDVDVDVVTVLCHFGFGQS